MQHRLLRFFLLLSFVGAVVFSPGSAVAQTPTQKEINDQTQFWWSINSTFHTTKKWGFMADFHIRRNDFIKDPNFYFLRGGANYWFTNKLVGAAGYAHMWLASPGAPPKEWAYADEHRIYQQLQMVNKWGKVSVLNRIRNEQRWQEKLKAGVPTGDWRFTNRFRYLLSFTFPVFKNPKAPSLVLADEILLHAGKEVVYNTFDQNRIFLGIRQPVTKDLSFDFGYMLLYQQKYTGYQYDRNHTIRWFFYYAPDWSKKHPGRKDMHTHHAGDE